MITTVLAWIGGICVTTWALILASSAWCVVHNRRIDRAKRRHPAGRNIQPGCDSDGLVPRVEPKRAPCGAWIGAESDDYWTRQFAEISHAVDCVTCQHETQGRAA